MVWSLAKICLYPTICAVYTEECLEDIKCFLAEADRQHKDKNKKGDSMAINLDKIFTYHPPKKDQPDRYKIIRDSAKDLARVILENTPESEDQNVAILKIREAVMLANASIAINES